MGLAFSQRTNLESAAIGELLANQILTLELAMGLNTHTRHALEDEDTRQRLIAGELIIADIIGGPVQHHAPHVHVPAINDGQSTHNAAVHQAVSASATKLIDRYGSKIAGAGLENVLAR